MDFGIFRLSFVAEFTPLTYELDFLHNVKVTCRKPFFSVTSNGIYNIYNTLTL